jgi:hypothetical protein
MELIRGGEGISKNIGLMRAMMSDIDQGVQRAVSERSADICAQVTADRREREYKRDPRNCGDFLERMKSGTDAR